MAFDLEAFDQVMASRYEAHKPRMVSIPPGQSGDWTIDTFEVKTGVHTLRAAMNGRGIPPGRYTRLWSKSAKAWMTDTPAEYDDARWFIRQAEGEVLVSGLGLGMVVKALLAKPEVTGLTVLEIEPDVIKLVSPHYSDPRLRIIQADAFTWRADRIFDWAWHDIWGDISADDLPEMTRMKRHYQRSMSAPGRQECWGQDLIRRDR